MPISFLFQHFPSLTFKNGNQTSVSILMDFSVVSILIVIEQSFSYLYACLIVARKVCFENFYENISVILADYNCLVYKCENCLSDLLFDFLVAKKIRLPAIVSIIRNDTS